jgi:AAA+ ATPase superfamily predicted ATPase
MPFAGRVSLYGLFGAIPAYLERVVPTLTLLENIRRSVLDRGSFLYSEVEFLLREELREPRNYFVILRAIAQGKRKMSEIINDTGMDKSHVSRYLDILRSLRLVEKEVPVTEKYPDKSRMGLYRLHDRFFTFWFRYVFPFRGRLEIGQVDHVLERIGETFDAFIGVAYEDICRMQCLSLMKKGVLAFTTLGRWWERNEEIDIVALDETQNVAWFGECKWSRKKVGLDIYEDLLRKSRLVSWQGSTRRDRYILFSRSGFTEAMAARAKEEGVVLIHGDSLIGFK